MDHLGATAFGFAQIDLLPDKAGSERDETESGQEEVYLYEPWELPEA